MKVIHRVLPRRGALALALAALLAWPLSSLAGETLVVHKDPNCGCCELWLDQLTDQGYGVEISHPQDIASIKLRHRIPPSYLSCHTAVSEQGFVFEGHIPGFLIARFLAEPPPGAIGLAVPGMPIGSPGMEIGERFDPYDVHLLMEDGSTQVWATMESPEQQSGIGH